MLTDEKLDRVKKLLATNNQDGVVVSSAALITYFTGYPNFAIEEREALLFITKSKHYILTDARYSEAVQKLVKNFELVEISSQNPVKKILESLAKKHKIQTVGIEEDNITVSEYKLLKKVFRKIQNINLLEIRAIKSADEIKKICEACKIGDQAFDYIRDKIKIGMSEMDVVYLIEDFMRKKGTVPSFDTIVAFDKNSSVPHHLSTSTKLVSKKGQFIKMDFGVKKDSYCSDMTRTIFWGKPDDRKIKIYETVKNAQLAAVKYLNEQLLKNPHKGVRASDVDKAAREFIVSQGFASIPHSLGHGIGIQVHEAPNLSPNSKSILEEGMVFSIEPGIYIPGYGGVRIEDLFAIQNKKLVQLTNSSKDLIIL